MALLSLTYPVPNAITTPHLLDPARLGTVHDLIKNPYDLRRWQLHISTVLEDVDRLDQEARGQSDYSDHPEADRALLGPKLASQKGRLALQKLTDVYERALHHFPSSYSLWNAYLTRRSSYVLGTPAHSPKLNAPKKAKAALRPLAQYLEGRSRLEQGVDEDEDLSPDDVLDPEEIDSPVGPWTGSLNGYLGYQEWFSLAALYERALTWLPRLPRLWISYLTLLTHPSCPSPLSTSHARHTLDRALKSLPPSLHSRIWKVFLGNLSSNRILPVSSALRIWKRYLAVDPDAGLFYSKWLVNELREDEDAAEKHASDVASLLLSLAVRARTETLSVPLSSYELFTQCVEVCAEFADAVESVVVGSEKKTVEEAVRSEGLAVYTDQAGKLWTALATYFIKRGDVEDARRIFDEGLGTVVTVRDFTQIFDAYSEFCESYLSGLMEELEGGELDEEEMAQVNEELDERMRHFEALMDKRPFLVNDVLLRRNSNDVQEWEKRVALHGDDVEQIALTYQEALKTIEPKKATANYSALWVNFARFYEEQSVDEARRIFERAVQVPFRSVNELAEVWCEWAEMELRHENYDKTIEVLQRALRIPNDTSVDFHDDGLPPQKRLFKSLKLWSYFVDIQEALGTVEDTRAAYDHLIELKIANAQIIVNYASFLEDHEYFEDSFRVFERALEVFTYPIAFELWNTYLFKFISRYGGDKLERARDLFEQALEHCPPKFCKPLYLMYGHLEEEYGLTRRAMRVYERATRSVGRQERLTMFTYYLAKVAQFYGLPATRPVYERALQVLPDKDTVALCLRFADMEKKLGETERARAIYGYAAQLSDPRTNAHFWSVWRAFELETGTEETFREYLRIRRAVQASFNTEASYVAAEATKTRDKGGHSTTTGGGQDAMAALDAHTRAAPAFVSAGGGEKKEKEEERNVEEIEIDVEEEEEEE